LSEAVAKGLRHEAISLFTTSVYSISGLLLMMFILAFLYIIFGNVEYLFPSYRGEDLTITVSFSVASFLLIIQGKIMHSAAASYHYSEVATFVNVLQNISICIILLLIGFVAPDKELSVFAASFFLLVIFIYTLPLIFFATMNYGIRVFSFYNFSVSHLKRLLSLGGKFFVLQISAVILYSTDTFLLQYFFRPEIAAQYGITLKYFGILVLITTIIGAPIWAATSSDMHSEDRKFLVFLRKNSHYLFACIIFLGLVLLLLQDIIFGFWVPTLSNSHQSLTSWILVYSIIQCVLFWFASIINGTGHLHLTFIFAPLAAVTNLFLCVVGIRYFGKGADWIVISTIIANFPSLIISSVQVFKILHNQQDGIWAR